MNAPYIGRATYYHGLRACDVDFSRFRFKKDEEWYRYRMALPRVLVHEATHGKIHDLGIGHDRESRLRAERLCHREEKRFLRRVSPHAEIDDIDETWLREYFEAGGLSRAARYIRRFREAD